jgi:hypothetical protein
MIRLALIGSDNHIRHSVESRTGAVALLRFPPPLIKPDVPISGIRLSDWLHRIAFGGGPM